MILAEQSDKPSNKTIQVGGLSVANHLPFVLFGGMNVLESEQLAVDLSLIHI